MDDRFRKISCFASTEISPPILLRRRLSVPETIMRKHMLAQQRSLSQESDRSQNSEGTQSCNWPDTSGSDTHLNRRRESNIRKSTLIKRFRENAKIEKALQFPRTYSEWQYSFGKLKMSSNSSTPEHIRSSRKSIYDDFILNKSPKHRRLSPQFDVMASPKRASKLSTSSSVAEESSPKHTMMQRGALSTSSLHRHEIAASDDYLMYSSNFISTVTTSRGDSTTTTRTAETTESETYHMDAPTTSESTNAADSAYTNSYSSFIQTSTPRQYQSPNIKIQHPTNSAHVIADEAINESSNHQINSCVSTAAVMPELPLKYQFVVKENADTNNPTNKTYEFIPKLDNNQNESSTQTNESTNLNVITNVHLSESTLNLIFKQVMQDVLQHKTVQPETVQPMSIINVANIPSFTIRKQADLEAENLDKFVEPTQKDIKLRTEVNVGSPYKVKGDQHQNVPRLSALPSTSSMDVNISSNESMDKESVSDTSLADSLEEAPICDDQQFAVRTSESSLLPDNSSKKVATIVTPKKASVFYIPMLPNEEIKELAASKEIVKDDVSSHFPAKLKEKLLQRQIVREEKQKENKLKSFAPLDCENGNYQYFERSSIDSSVSKPKARKKTTLPVIENNNNIKKKDQFRSTFTQRSLSKYRESVETTTPPNLNKNKSYWLPKTKNKLSPINKHEPEPLNLNTRRFYQKADKQIEILEIMEIVEPPRIIHLIPKNKSKIPVLVHQKLPKIHQQKPSYLDFEITQNDPKLDQLIANILIDTLNREDAQNTNIALEQNGNFEVIPEEKSRCNSTDLLNKQNNHHQQQPNLIEQAAEILTKQVLDNNNLEGSGPKFAESLDSTLDQSNIPKGWITFYMLQKNSSPDSTSEEGNNINKKARKLLTKKATTTSVHRRRSNKSKYFIKERIRNKKGSDYKTDEYFETETESDLSILKKHKLKKSREKRIQKQQQTEGGCGGWSVTISANNSNYDKCAPEVEMRLKFNGRNNQTPPTEKKTTSHDCQTNTEEKLFPPVIAAANRDKKDLLKLNSNNTGSVFEDRRVCDELSKAKHFLKNPAEYTCSVIPSRLEPRPTKLSMQRCLLHHRSTIPKATAEEVLFAKQNDNRNYEHHEYIKLPEISVNGNTYQRRRNGNLDKLLNEPDFKTYLSQIRNQP